MRLVFSFDDGRKDSIVASNILHRHHLAGSFHITTGFIDGTFITNEFGIGRDPLSTEDILNMWKSGDDVSSHGDKHILEPDDFLISYNKLKKIIPVSHKIGFSIPNSLFTMNQLNNFSMTCQDLLLYIRKGRDSGCYSFFNKILYIFYHTFHLHIQTFYNLFNAKNVIFNFDKFNLPSIVIKKDCSSANVINFLKKYSKKNVIIILMFHSIVDKPLNKWEYPLFEFEKICYYVEESNIECITLKELANDF